MGLPLAVTGLREHYAAESARLRQSFEMTGDGATTVTARAELVDGLVLKCVERITRTGAHRIAIAAIGGYGRKALFPYSDIDLLFLCADDATKQAAKDLIRHASQDLWDIRLKLSPATRTLSECDRLDSDNVEFSISLMDSRFLAGDRGLYDKLRNQVFPGLVNREWQSLVQLLVERTQSRHDKFGRTIFHLEPNIKEVPGGMRDYNVVCWLSLLAQMESDSELPEGARTEKPELEGALRFLMSTRTFLHWRAGRDDNMLSWEAQDQAAGRSIGSIDGPIGNATEWMRLYFRHARVINRLTSQLMQEIPARRSSLYRQFVNWRGRISNPEFSVSNGRVYFQNPSSLTMEMILRAFEFIARHGFQLAGDTEARIQRAMPDLSRQTPAPKLLGASIISIMKAPHAGHALRAMHVLGVLNTVIPEFQLIDSLVVRDFYHRYTVDEHTFIAIDNLHRLPDRENEWEKNLAELLSQMERPEALYLSLLFHDLGKGMPSHQHAVESVELAAKAMERLGLEPNTRDTVLFLIASHLEMSAAMRRDIFDPENVRAFAAKIGTHEHLRLLCLMTYADIRAVNPEALTPWKAESLWRLYVAANNQLDRGIDDDLIHASTESEQVKKLQKLLFNRPDELDAFLEGLPRRYLLSHSSDQIAVHFDMSLRVPKEPVVVGLKLSPELYELSVVTSDRPYLFTKIAGTLASWGMNIIKANAFSNAAGVVVDSFFFKDRFRTLELNPPERDRFKRSVSDVINGKADLQQLLQRRGIDNGPSRLAVVPKVTLDQDSSSHSTLIEVVAPDKTGLLYQIASEISEEGCNIELALIDTEGQTAIDVFYVTRNGKKLSSGTAKALRKSLLEELQG
jgi:[protein-PII] uridylyltransferase